MRPRDLLNFLHRATETAINRGRQRVFEDDVLTAERAYSEDMLVAVSLELRDSNAAYTDLLYEFIGEPAALDIERVTQLLGRAKVAPEDHASAIELLLWMGFLGVQSREGEEGVFAYQVRYNVGKLRAALRADGAMLVVHPAFRRALGSDGRTSSLFA